MRRSHETASLRRIHRLRLVMIVSIRSSRRSTYRGCATLVSRDARTLSPGRWPQEHDPNADFNMTLCALGTANWVNGVAALHGKVSRDVLATGLGRRSMKCPSDMSPTVTHMASPCDSRDRGRRIARGTGHLCKHHRCYRQRRFMGGQE